MTHIYNLRLYLHVWSYSRKIRNIKHLPRREGNQLVIDKAIIIFEKVHLDLVLKIVGIFRKFSVNGKFILELWS